MKTTSVTAHYERKLNTGDYSSVTLSAWATVEVEPADDADDAMTYAMSLCRGEVRLAAEPFIKKGIHVANVDELFAGLPVNGAQND
jgi:hypothetical protein